MTADAEAHTTGRPPHDSEADEAKQPDDRPQSEAAAPATRSDAEEDTAPEAAAGEPARQTANLRRRLRARRLAARPPQQDDAPAPQARPGGPGRRQRNRNRKAAKASHADPSTSDAEIRPADETTVVEAIRNDDASPEPEARENAPPADDISPETETAAAGPPPSEENTAADAHDDPTHSAGDTAAVDARQTDPAPPPADAQEHPEPETPEADADDAAAHPADPGTAASDGDPSETPAKRHPPAGRARRTLRIRDNRDWLAETPDGAENPGTTGINPSSARVRSALARRRLTAAERDGERGRERERWIDRAPQAEPVADTHSKRQAQRIEGNGSVVIDDHLFSLKDWSLLGLAIPSDGQIFQVGDRRLLELEIDLGDYAVNLDLSGEVMNRDRDRIGWRFVDPTETQRQVLRALAHAVLSGQPPAFSRAAVTAGPTGYDRRDGTKGGAPAASYVRSRSGRRARPGRTGAFGGLMSLTLNAVIIALLAGAAIYAIGGDPFGSPSEDEPATPALVRAQQAAVAVKRLALDAPFAGTVLAWEAAAGAAINQNELLVTMLTDDEAARRIIIKSPCDCYLARINVAPGGKAHRLQSLGTLYARGSTGEVHALFRADAAPQAGDTVSVSLPYSGETYSGVVEYVGESEPPDAYIGLPITELLDNSDTVFARIRTTPALPASKAGDPAVVTLRPAPAS